MLEQSSALIWSSLLKCPATGLRGPCCTQATKEDIDVVICDTSGRLHTNVGLMEELAKCKRSIAKRLEGAPHETLLILDGTTGAALHSYGCSLPL